MVGMIIGGGVSGLSLIWLFLVGIGLASGGGWVSFLLLLWGLLMFSLGFVGIYVGRTYKDVRGRPRYIVKDTIGLDD